MAEALQAWLAIQYRHSCRQMLQSISRTDLVKQRPGFGQSVRAAAGSVVASPVLADWDPEPDYFFHWFRDSAIVMDALRLLFEDGSVGDEALVMFGDFIAFSNALRRIDGRSPALQPGWRDGVREDFHQYLRDERELAEIRGDGVVAETRVNPDGTPDISKWTRPQHDGAALRALTLLRWHRHVQGLPLEEELAGLLRHDLAFVQQNWNRPAFDMWEEDCDLHYHTLAVSAAALAAGADWHEAGGEHAPAQHCRQVAALIRQQMHGFWRPDLGFYASRKDVLDISVVFAVIHGWDGSGATHTAGDPRVHATLDHLVALFAGEYAINGDRRNAPAMGRYRGDRYFSGGAYYFSTFAAAELCFRAASLAEGASARQWRQRGDGFLATIRDFTPASGELSEQFDQRTGAQVSARQLAWSHAAFISCHAARRACMGNGT